MPSRALALCFASGTTEKQGYCQVCHARVGDPRTASRTADTNLDRAFIENALAYTGSLIVKSQQNRIELVTRPGQTLKTTSFLSFNNIKASSKNFYSHRIPHGIKKTLKQVNQKKEPPIDLTAPHPQDNSKPLASLASSKKDFYLLE